MNVGRTYTRILRKFSFKILYFIYGRTFVLHILNALLTLTINVAAFKNLLCKFILPFRDNILFEKFRANNFNTILLKCKVFAHFALNEM